MCVLRRSYLFMLLTLLILCITSCANTRPTASITANTSNQQATLALANQAGLFTDSTPSLIVTPNPLNENNCHTSNHQTWTCTVTLIGENLGQDAVSWNAYTSNSSISISPSQGHLLQLDSFVQVTISNIPCVNTYFLFSGQVYGGGGVIPATVPWSCIPKPTPIPTHQPIPNSTPQATPTPKIKVLTSTPSIPRSTPTITSSPTSVVSSDSHSNPPIQGNGDPSANMFIVFALIFTMLVAVIELFIIALMSRRMNFKRP